VAKDKTPPKWYVPSLIVGATIFGAIIVIDVVSGDRPDSFPVTICIVCVLLAFIFWRQRRKAAGSPPE